MVGPRGVVGALGAGAGGSDRKGLRKEACYTVSNLVAGSRQQLKVPPPPPPPPPPFRRRAWSGAGIAQVATRRGGTAAVPGAAGGVG